MTTSVVDHWPGSDAAADDVVSAVVLLPVQAPPAIARTASERITGGTFGSRVRVSPGAIQLQTVRPAGWQVEKWTPDERDQLLERLGWCRRQLDRLEAELAHVLHNGGDPVRFEDWYWRERLRFVDELEACRHRLGLIRRRGRSRIGEWSRRSRARMTRRLATLDWSPMAATDELTPAMVTLTYPGDYLAVCPTGEMAKRHLKAFRAWWERRMGPASGVWKLERQRRGAPHFHLLLLVPHAHMGRQLDALRWDARHAWARIVGATGEDRRRHEFAGVSIDIAEGSRYCDPARIAVYFSKHNAATAETAKAYQNEAPDGWIDPEDGGGVGRWWGYWRLRPVEVDADLSRDDADELRRLLRGWVKAQGRRRVVRRKRVDRRTGVVRLRKQTERYDVRALAFARPSGFVLCSDAPGLVRELARAMTPAPDWPPGQRRPLP